MATLKGQHGTQIEVVHEHRDLCGHLDITRQRTGTKLAKRMKEAAGQCKAMAHLPGLSANEHRIIATHYLARGAVMGPTRRLKHWAVVNKLAPAITDSYLGKCEEARRRTRSLVLSFHPCGANPNSTADPWHSIFHKRIRDLRRAWVKRPHLRGKITVLVEATHEPGRPGIHRKTQNDTIPMPRGRATAGGGWICKPGPPGLIALAMQSAAVHNPAIPNTLNIESPCTQHFHIVEPPIHFAQKSPTYDQ